MLSYRDGGLHVHPSVLSSLSTSYTQEDLGYYDDLARNLDANLAEVDMESFRTADIHTLLTALPVMCTDPIQQSEVIFTYFYSSTLFLEPKNEHKLKYFQ